MALFDSATVFELFGSSDFFDESKATDFRVLVFSFETLVLDFEVSELVFGFSKDVFGFLELDFETSGVVFRVFEVFDAGSLVFGVFGSFLELGDLDPEALFAVFEDADLDLIPDSAWSLALRVDFWLGMMVPIL